ncbi:AAA family ATPase [Nocardia sp. NBC_01388]|uniref:helix-turn-helix transcriptional regulator n=1 Tax=Nocardia sp. NBC_01388 TaxID=2903596 RepID=UPI00325001E8
MRDIEGLYGREQEQVQLGRMLAMARSGRGSAIVLHGEPGAGKSALLRDTIAGAADFRVHGCEGDPAESELNFAALHELLLPLSDRLTALPAPQAEALAQAFESRSDPVDGFLVGAALVTLFAALAGEQPVLLVVGDAHLVDAATTRALRFAMRRLITTPVVLLCALSGDPAQSGWDRLPTLRVGGLSDAAARRLLEQRWGVLGALRTARVLRVAGGNPLALRELPVQAEEFAGIAAGPVTLGPRLAAAYHDRIAALPDAVRTLLRLVAAEDRGVLRVVLAAAATLWHTGGAHLGGAQLASAWEQVESVGLLVVGDGRVEMRNRLLCMAVYDAATPAQRRSAHLALAAVLTGPEDIDQRAWHRAAATDPADEQLAAILTERAEHTRDGSLAAAAMLRRAAAITPDPLDAGARMAAAARLAWAGGDIESARRLLDRAVERIGTERAAIAGGGLAGLLEFVAGEPDRANVMLLHDAAVVDDRTAAELRALAAQARWAAGHDDAVPMPMHFDTADFGPGPSLSICQLPPAPLVLLWGLADRALEPFTRATTRLRNAGARAAAVFMLPQLAIVQFANGRLPAAEATLADAFELARSVGTDNVLAHCWNLNAKIAALRGDSDIVGDSIERALALARPHRAHALIASSYWHLGFDALSNGDPETAYLRLRALAQPGHDARHPTYARLAAPDMVEAACRIGRVGEAAEYYETIRAWAIRSRADWAMSAAYTCRALLSEDERADHYFRRALAVRRTRHDLNHARTRLLYGKWLRRARRRGDAAEQLRTALESFERMGAVPWIVSAQQELDLTGRAPTLTPGTGPGSVLTAQELRVARLAAQGLTNREIGVELFVSPRTVGHHLSRTFGKLGLGGRAELADIDFDNGLRISRQH